MRQFFLSALIAILLVGCGSTPPKPEAQVSLENKLKEILKVYKQGKQGDTAAQKYEYQKKAVDMRNALFEELDPHFDGWICKVTDVRKALTTKDELVLYANCGFFNIGNSEDLIKRDGPAPQSVPKGYPLYDKMMQLKKGDVVKVSGVFHFSGIKIRESSVTTSGSMEEPNFGVIYSDVAPVKQ